MLYVMYQFIVIYKGIPMISNSAIPVKLYKSSTLIKKLCRNISFYFCRLEKNEKDVYILI